MISSTTAGGAEAPAVRPIVDTPVSQLSWISSALSIRCAGVPFRSQASTSRTELEEFAEPATSTRSASAATARTAACLLVVERSQRDGTPAYLIDGATDIDLDWLAGVEVVGLTAGASAPPAVVSEIIDALSGLGTVTVTERVTTTESVQFGLPREVR